MLAGSAVLSYAYAKSEIMSAAGVFYALVVFLAVARADAAACSQGQGAVAATALFW